MNAAARLGLFGAGLVALFAVSALTASAVVPDEVAAAWNTTDREEQDMQDGDGMQDDENMQDGGEHSPSIGGLAASEGGFTLDALTAPPTPGESGTLSFRIVDAEGVPVEAYDVQHDKQLHLIVVRSDGTGFRHVHPELAADGTWSLPWTWDAAGSYRVYADFAASGADPVTLSSSVEVAGDYAPADPQPVRRAVVDGYQVRLAGDLVAGRASDLTLTVSRNGEPVPGLEPSLGAFGHLVALRQSDLGFVHVHPAGDEPQAGDVAGPDVTFATAVPTEGRYLLFFDFQVAGRVRSAPFVVDATAAAAGRTP